ncbi:hypothetical protein [Pseudomonas sp. GD03944]|uniref:hypothetical protein n=1 Tax=Pseudomonas sp. GD03944 TaxID=2975409 RepID=UPI002447C735|nr:hypothetical protein [Pseudomonas sp. GD03944]MDH1265676.1 hypothetical protein [Pseudomonas sp. GD03944]
MNNVLISTISAVWRDHVLDRISAAKEIGLLDSGDLPSLQEATIIFPDEFDSTSIAASTPETPINKLLNLPENAPGKWIERFDCLEGAAHLLRDLSSNKELVFMFCEAGYSKAGDKFLDNYEYILIGGNPIIFINILEKSVLEVARLLKAGRSTRILGVIRNDVEHEREPDGNASLFFCDALDGDSIIICPLAST